MKLLRPLTPVVLSALAPGNALVSPPNPVRHHVPAGIVRHREVHETAVPARATAAIKTQHTLVAAAAATEGGGRGAPAAENPSTAKERFLGNLERKRAGEDVRSSVLDADLSVLSTAGRNRVPDSKSWRGEWEICHAPHIETLGKVILTKFGSVRYDFVSDDGRMVSHAGYESPVFGSGWFSADGRVVTAPAGDGMAGDDDHQDVVKVGLETRHLFSAWRTAPPFYRDGKEAGVDDTSTVVNRAGSAVCLTTDNSTLFLSRLLQRQFPFSRHNLVGFDSAGVRR